MKNRILTGIGLAFALILFFVLKAYVSNYAFDVLIFAIMIFATFESSKIFSKIGYYNDRYVIGSFVTILFLISQVMIGFETAILTILLIDLLIILGLNSLLFIFNLCKKGAKREMNILKIDSKFKYAINRTLGSVFAMLYPAFLLISLLLINHIDALGIGKIEEYDNYLSLIILIFTFIIPIITDVFAMLTGILIGGRKLCPKLSPKKTLSGAIGGVVFTIIISACLYLILNSTPIFSQVFFNSAFALWKLLIIVFFGSMIAQCGDLFESYLKRKAGVKDSGNALPGHGGVLDRVDSHIFVSVYMLFATIILLLI